MKKNSISNKSQDIEIGKKYESIPYVVEVVGICENGELIVYKRCFECDECDYGLKMRNSFIKIFKPVKERETGTAYLEVDELGNLKIQIKGTDIRHMMGFIAADGKCYIQSDTSMHEATEFWKEQGAKVDATPVNWRGAAYNIRENPNVLAKMDDFNGVIWNLIKGMPVEDCGDENIIRNDKNVPLIF